MRSAALLGACLLLAPGPALAAASKKGPQRSFAYWKAKAANAVRKKDEKAVLAAYGKALAAWRRKNGKKAKTRILLKRAAIHERRKHWRSALKDVSLAIRLGRKTAKDYHRRGKLYLKIGKPSKALDDFNKAVTIDPLFGDAFYYRGLANKIMGNRAFAKEDFQEACSLEHKKACRKGGIKKGSQKKTAKKKRVSRSMLFSSCMTSLQRCMTDLTPYEVCVKKNTVCGKNHTPGCCPRTCKNDYIKLLDNELSQAAAFRMVFIEKNPCFPAKGKTPYAPAPAEPEPAEVALPEISPVKKTLPAKENTP